MSEHSEKDCNGIAMNKGDNVEVVEEEPLRAGNPNYKFCSVGAKGIVVFVDDPLIGNVQVEFPTATGQKTVGCAPNQLRVV